MCEICVSLIHLIYYRKLNKVLNLFFFLLCVCMRLRIYFIEISDDFNSSVVLVQLRWIDSV